MPYQREFASKVAHADLVRNPEVRRFLRECDYLRPPSEGEARAVAACFVAQPSTEGIELPDRVVAIDGSCHESSLDDRLPSTKVGYVKVSAVLIDLAEYRSLRVGRFADPFRVAALRERATALAFALPSANIRWQGRASVRDSFRAAVDAALAGPATRFEERDPGTGLRTTLFHLAARRPDGMGTGDPTRLRLHRCPDCGEGPLEVEDVPDAQHCPHCRAEVYPSDCLRLWEDSPTPSPPRRGTSPGRRPSCAATPSCPGRWRCSTTSGPTCTRTRWCRSPWPTAPRRSASRRGAGCWTS